MRVRRTKTEASWGHSFKLLGRKLAALWLAAQIGYRSVPAHNSLARRKPSQIGAKIGLALILAALPAPAAAAAPPLVDSVALVEFPNRYDGKVITYVGEAIGDVMQRTDGAWINVNDDAYIRQGKKRRLAGYNSGQSVLFADKQLAAKIKRLGDYNNRGDRIRITGIFHKACPEHGGDMMIHAQTLTAVKSGFSLPHPISARKISLAGTWLVIGGVVLALWQLRKRSVRH